MADLVSIITPTYNRAYILGDAIRSILAQSYTEWEMLVVDDGSTDNTEEVVKSFKDKRLVYKRLDTNHGQPVARNNGLEIAKGRWITFLDSDDTFLPICLERLVATFKKHKEVQCIIPQGNKTITLWEEGTCVRSVALTDAFPNATENIVKNLFMRRFHFAMNAFIHSSSIRDEGIRFDESIRYMEDWDYALKIAQKHSAEFFYLTEPVYNYEQRYGTDGVVSGKSYAGIAESFEQIYQNHKSDPLMEGQTWYPQRVEKWRKIQADFEKGLVPPPYLYLFQK